MDARPWQAPDWWPRLQAATAELPAPIAVLERDALRFNTHDMLRRAAGMPIRIATKSIRVRSVIDALAAVPGYAGLLAFTLPEALWLAETHQDVVVGYPSVNRQALAALIADERAAARVTLMVDSLEQLDLIDAIAAPGKRPSIRLCLDVDASWQAPLLGHIGVRRSPLYRADEAAALARQIAARPGFTLVGVMMYEAQIAGQGDATGSQDGVVRWMQRCSRAELLERRAAVVAGVREAAELEFVNGGGTGSLEYTGHDAACTEVTAGSGLLAGHLFDGYRHFAPAPAAAFAMDVVRKPQPDIATVLGGGWIASGPPLDSRQPRPVWPEGLKRQPREGSGEVQTPLQGAAARELRVGDRVWFRHAKSGELSERVNEFALVADGQVVEWLPSYRGEGRAFL